MLRRILRLSLIENRVLGQITKEARKIVTELFEKREC